MKKLSQESNFWEKDFFPAPNGSPTRALPGTGWTLKPLRLLVSIIKVTIPIHLSFRHIEPAVFSLAHHESPLA